MCWPRSGIPANRLPYYRTTSRAMSEIVFTDDALDDLRRLGPDTVPKVLKKISLLAEDPMAGHPLGEDLTGFRKLVVGRSTWRIVYRISADRTVEICEIWAVGARANAEVYAETVRRVRRAGARQPDFYQLLNVFERLGLATPESLAAQPPVVREPVPD